MWAKFANFLFKFRIAIVLFFVALTVFMAFKAKNIQLSYAGSKILPKTDSSFIAYDQFKKQFGEDGGLVVLGVQTPQLYKKEFFNAWQETGDSIKNIPGVSTVLSYARLFKVEKDTVNRKFVFTPYPAGPVQSDAEMDSIKAYLGKIKLLNQLVYNNKTSATLMLIGIKGSILNTKARNPLLHKIEYYAGSFSRAHNTPVHISGMPYIRTAVSKLVSQEFVLFLGLSIGIAALILLIFFRRIYAVIFPMLVVIMGVICSVGTMVLFGYELTTLTGLIPPLIVIIGVPNSILFLNKYIAELKAGRPRTQALHIAVERISETTLIANLTAAIGFAVLIYTNSEVLVQFGAVAAINVIITWLLSICLVPIIFSWLPALHVKGEQPKKTIIDRFLSGVNNLVLHRRTAIYIATALLAAIAAIGITRIKVNGYVVDDLPSNSAILHDLHFFENNFEGILPLEVVVDTKKSKGVQSIAALKKIEKLEDTIAAYPEFSKPLSMVQGIKLATQAFYNNDSAYYRLPDGFDQAFVLTYLSNSTSGAGNSAGNTGNLLKGLTDSKGRYAHLTFRMKDVGSARLDQLLAELQQKVKRIMPADKYNVVLTGSSIIFSKGTNYMLRHLFESIGLDIILISLLRLVQFKSIKIMLLSLLPNIVPLMITAGVMGFFGLNLKPSTIIVFTIAFGLASDQTIYFLTRYQQDKKRLGLSTVQAVSSTLHETGVSMVHIAMVLFFGFGIFIASTFGGTVILGLLLSVTLLVALIFNLTLLPALVIWAQGNNGGSANGQATATTPSQTL